MAEDHMTVDLRTLEPSAYGFRLRGWREKLAALRGKRIELPMSRLGAVLRIGTGPHGGGGGEYAPEDTGKIYSGSWQVPKGVRSVGFQVIGGGGASGQFAQGGTGVAGTGIYAVPGSGGGGGGYHEPGGRSADELIAQIRAAREEERQLVEHAARLLMDRAGDDHALFGRTQDAYAIWQENFGALGGEEFAEGAGEVLKMLAGVDSTTLDKENGEDEGGENT